MESWNFSTAALIQGIRIWYEVNKLFVDWNLVFKNSRKLSFQVDKGLLIGDGKNIFEPLLFKFGDFLSVAFKYNKFLSGFL